VPADGSVELIATTSGAGALPQERLIHLCNAEMSKALTSQTLATEIQGQGSRAAAETHADRAAGVSSSDRESIADSLSQLCAWITELNIPGALPPRVEFYEEAQARQDWTDVLDKARGFIDVPVSFAHDRLQIPQAQKGEAVLPRTAAPAPIGPAALGGPQFSARAGHDHAAGDDATALAQAERLHEEAAAAHREWLERIRSIVDTAPDLPTLRDRLLDAYGELPTERLAAVMRMAFAAADLGGRFDVADEAGQLEG
jgi:phage gp29-like protein